MQSGGILAGGPGNGAGTGPVNFMGGGMGSEAEEETPNVSPEEQEQYDTVVKNAREIMYTAEGKVQEEVLTRLGTGNKPIDTLAQATVWLVMLVEQDAKRNGVEIDDGVLLHAGREIMEQLIEIAEAADLHEFKEAEIQGAWYQALDMYREANTGEGGRIDEEGAKAEFEELNEADKEGRADEVIPGFGQLSEQGIAMAMADQNEVEEEEDTETKTLNKKGNIPG